MIINKEHHFIFVHVPKTAGNAVEVTLPKCNRRKNRKLFRQMVPTEKHLHLEDTKPDGMFSFGFTRNPWDRMVSLYHFRSQKDNQNNKFDQQRLKDLGFEKCLLTGILGINNPPWDRPELNMTNDAMTWLEGCDFIGQYEKLQEDFDFICKVLKLGQRDLPHTNSSKHDDYKKYYTQEMIDYVADTHKRTIDLFGYTFDNR
jgi:hypothetical protein